MKNRQIYLTNIDANIILWKEILDPKNIAEKLNLSNLGQLTQLPSASSQFTGIVLVYKDFSTQEI